MGARLDERAGEQTCPGAGHYPEEPSGWLLESSDKAEGSSILRMITAYGIRHRRRRNSMSKVWFITGTSKGFGHVWAAAALDRGDRVAATARDTESLASLVERHGDAILPIALDVTDKTAVDAAVAQAHDHFGRLDVVVNNAGYGLFGTIEEITEQQARAQIETNLFGALWVTKAALPYLREQGSGHIIQVSSIGASRRSRRSASTTPPSGVSRRSASRSPPRSPTSGSR
jgi:NAD(P)-dependent dehydrogenase (short-subunit alcohol dehydrogenase family)